MEVARALGLPFGSITCTEGMSESHLLGMRLPDENGNWVYFPSAHVRIIEGGGVWLYDDFDAGDKNTLLTVNNLLSLGLLDLPFRFEAPVARKHENSIIIAACNTMGTGGDGMYTARTRLDESTADRLKTSTFYIGYDKVLEERIAADADHRLA